MQFIPLKPLRQIWLKAAVAGSIWASVEIILGSFLHNLRIPFSGMFLSIISVWLLIYFVQVWNENGLVLRAGLICALMKSISPSAIILGPMIGILSEALLIEFFIFIIGKNFAGYLVGGAFAVLSTLAHKIVSLLIYYGFDFIKILTDLYYYLAKQLRIEQAQPATLIALVTGIYIIAGMTAAASGYFSGKRHFRNKISESQEDLKFSRSENTLFNSSETKKYSVWLLLLNIFSLAVILFLINTNHLIPAALLASVYLSLCIWHYRSSLRRLQKVSFWLSFIVITIAASFLWNGFANGAFFTADGLSVGLKMNARAAILIIGFASVSVELRNPVIKSVLYHKGFASLYQSLSLSFSALPFILSTISPSTGSAGRITGKSFRTLFSRADSLLSAFRESHLQKPVVVIITGDVHQGKTTLTGKVIAELKKEKIRIAGFLAPAVFENGKRLGFDLLNLQTSERIELCRTEKDDSRADYGQYFFNPLALTAGHELLKPGNLDGMHLAVIDEIGPLELKGKGWSNAVDILGNSSKITQVWVVRRTLLEKVIKKWNPGDVWLFDISTDNESDVTDKIKEIIFTRDNH